MFRLSCESHPDLRESADGNGAIFHDVPEGN